MPAVITSTEYGLLLAVGALPEIPFSTPAWEITSYLPHYDAPPVVGDDRPIQGVPGRLSMPTELDEDELSFRMVFYGTHDYEGNAYADALDGVRQNLVFFRTNVLLPRIDRPYEFHTRYGDVYSGNIKIVPPLAHAELGPTGTRAVLKVKIPDAVLELVP